MNRTLPFFSHMLRSTLCIVLSLSVCSQAVAQVKRQQVERPSSEYVFKEDVGKAKKARKESIKQIIQTDPANQKELDFKAARVEFDKEQNVVKGFEGIVVSSSGLQAQAESGSLNLDTKELKLEDNVVVSDPRGTLKADSGRLNLDSESGEFCKANFEIEEGGYGIEAETLKKLSETEYELEDSLFSTCHCADDVMPWSIKSSRCHITQEGYAHSYNTSLNVLDFPVLYTPYLGFPVKTERTSGFLVADAGYSDEDGFSAILPYFVVLDDSSDLTIAPFTKTKTRSGAAIDWREAFSRTSNLTSRFYY